MVRLSDMDMDTATTWLEKDIESLPLPLKRAFCLVCASSTLAARNTFGKSQCDDMWNETLGVTKVPHDLDWMGTGVEGGA